LTNTSNTTVLNGMPVKVIANVSNQANCDATFNYEINSNSNNINVFPSNGQIVIPKNGNALIEFYVSQLNNVNAVGQQFSFKLTNISQYGVPKSDTLISSINTSQSNLTPTFTPNNGVCEWWLGENTSNSPIDCPESSDPNVQSDRLSCISRNTDWWILGWNYTGPQALGLIPSKCEPTYNYGLVIIGLSISVVLILGLIVITKNKPRVKRK
jgi:hypothetical protein